jgi:hypothetical protein
VPRALTFQIVDSDLLDDVGAGPAQSISFDHVSDHPSSRSRAFAVTPTSRISGAPPGAPGLTMITKVHFAFLEELPSCLT